MLLDTPLLNTLQFKVHIKSKVEQSKEKSVVAIEKGAFWLLPTKVANFSMTKKKIEKWSNWNFQSN